MVGISHESVVLAGYRTMIANHSEWFGNIAEHDLAILRNSFSFAASTFSKELDFGVGF